MCDELVVAGARRLVRAAVMQAVQDYRYAVFYGELSTEAECERFFEDVCFGQSYIEKLKEGVLKFKNKLSELHDAAGRESRAFVCPICGAKVVLSFPAKYRRAKCEGCGMSGTIAEDASNSAS